MMERLDKIVKREGIDQIVKITTQGIKGCTSEEERKKYLEYDYCSRP